MENKGRSPQRGANRQSGKVFVEGSVPYFLRPNDVIQVEVLGQPDLNRTAVVRPDGKVALVLLGDVAVGNMMPAEVAEKLTRLYSEYIVGPVVTVKAVRMSSEGGHIPGKAEREGPVRGTPEMTIKNAIDRLPAEVPASDQTKPDPATDGAWGEAISGIQARLVADRTHWKAGEVPKLVAEVRDLRDRGFGLTASGPALLLEIDGVVYAPARSSKAEAVPIPAGRFDSVSIDLVPEKWVSTANAHPDLKPGKHVVRATFAVYPLIPSADDAVPIPSTKDKPVNVVTRLVEIEIPAPDEK